MLSLIRFSELPERTLPYSGHELVAMTQEGVSVRAELSSLFTYPGIEKTVLTSEIISDVNVGAITIGQSFSAGTTFQQFAELLLKQNAYLPTFVEPYIALTPLAAAVFEIGINEITFTVGFNRGLIKGGLVGDVWDSTVDQGYRIGDATKYIILGKDNSLTPTLLSSVNIGEGTNTYDVVVEYGEGDQPYNSKGSPYGSPYPAGAMLSSFTIIGRRKLFYAADSNTDIVDDGSDLWRFGQIPGFGNSEFITSNDIDINITVPAGARRIIIAYPSYMGNIEKITQDSWNVTDTFSKKIISYAPEKGGCDSINYNVYWFTSAVAFPVSILLNVTN